MVLSYIQIRGISTGLTTPVGYCCTRVALNFGTLKTQSKAYSVIQHFIIYINTALAHRLDTQDQREVMVRKMCFPLAFDVPARSTQPLPWLQNVHTNFFPLRIRGLVVLMKRMFYP